MKTKRPSRTAHFVALGRAMADAGPDFRDPTARVFLNDKGKQSLAKIELAVRSEYRSTRLEMARVMADLIAAGAASHSGRRLRRSRLAHA